MNWTSSGRRPRTNRPPSAVDPAPHCVALTSLASAFRRCFEAASNRNGSGAITPQVILGGTFLPVEQLPCYLEYFARAMPVTYLVEAMQYVVLGAGTAEEFRVSLAGLLSFGLAAVVAGAVVRRAGRSRSIAVTATVAQLFSVALPGERWETLFTVGRLRRRRRPVEQ